MADKVLENADPEWVKEIIYEAKELYPLPSDEYDNLANHQRSVGGIGSAAYAPLAVGLNALGC